MNEEPNISSQSSTTRATDTTDQPDLDYLRVKEDQKLHVSIVNKLVDEGTLPESYRDTTGWSREDAQVSSAVDINSRQVHTDHTIDPAYKSVTSAVHRVTANIRESPNVTIDCVDHERMALYQKALAQEFRNIMSKFSDADGDSTKVVIKIRFTANRDGEAQAQSQPITLKRTSQESINTVVYMIYIDTKILDDCTLIQENGKDVVASIPTTLIYNFVSELVKCHIETTGGRPYYVSTISAIVHYIRQNDHLRRMMQASGDLAYQRNGIIKRLITTSVQDRLKLKDKTEECDVSDERRTKLLEQNISLTLTLEKQREAIVKLKSEVAKFEASQYFDKATGKPKPASTTYRKRTPKRK